MAGASAEMAGALVGVWVSLSMESRHAYRDPRFPTWQLGPMKEKAEATKPVKPGFGCFAVSLPPHSVIKASHKASPDWRDGK